MSEILIPKSEEPESLKGEELPDVAEDASETRAPEARPEKQQDAKDASAKPATKADEHEDEDQESVPDDLAGLKRALAAARGDKRKARRQWQETERAMAELRGRMSVMQAHPQVATQTKPQLPAGPKLGDAFYEKGPEAVEAYVAEYVRAQTEAIEKRFAEREHKRREKSVARARAAHEDFQEAWDAAVEMTAKNPQLEAQMLEEDDLGEVAYAYGKSYLQLRGINSIDDLKAKHRAEFEAEMAAKQQGAEPQPILKTPAPKTPIPRSLASARGTGAGIKSEWTGPRSMSSILK